MPTKFIFLLLPEIHLLDLAGPDQVINEAIDLGADFKLEYCSTTTEIKSSSGLGCNKLTHFSKVKINPGDYIIVPGARVSYIRSEKFKANKSLFSWLKKANDNHVNIVSICVGAFALAEAGLLNQIECTTHFQLIETLQENFPKAIVKDNILFVCEKNIYTSAGIASGIDLMLHIVENLTDGYFAHKIARELLVYNRRDGSSGQESIYFQFRNHIHSGIHRVQDYIVEHIQDKLHLQILAEKANMSERNFTRLFKKETGITVKDYVSKVRLEKINTLLKNPDISKKQLAQNVGLASEKQLSRLVKSIG